MDKLSDRYFRGYGYSENVGEQVNCVKEASKAGLTWGFGGLAASAAAVLGAGKIWPKFDRSLSVSSRTALIVMPFFALFFLQAELTLNDCGQRKKMMQRAIRMGLVKPGEGQGAAS